MQDPVRVPPLGDGEEFPEPLPAPASGDVLVDHVHPHVGQHLGHLLVHHPVGVVGVAGDEDHRLPPAPRLLEDPFVGGREFPAELPLRPERPVERPAEPPLPDPQGAEVAPAGPGEQEGVVEGDRGGIEGDGGRAPRQGGVFQDLGVGGDDGAVEAVGRLLELLLPVDHVGKEDAVHPLFGQVGHVAVGELGRQADVVRHQRPDPPFVQRLAALVREHHPEAAPLEQGAPEGEVLVHVEHPGDADAHPLSRLRALRPGGGEEQFALAVVDVGAAGGSRAPPPEDLLALVPAVADPAVGEAVDGDAAPVGAAAAGARPGRGGSGLPQPVEPDERTLPAAPEGEERGPVGPHQFGPVGNDHPLPRQEFEAAQDGGVAEEPPLDHHRGADLVPVADAQHLVEAVFDHGAGQPGGEVARGGAVPDRLPHPRVHEHGAARTEVVGGGRFGRQVGECGGGVPQGVGEILEERPAPRGAGLVDLDVAQNAVAHEDGLHVLPADIEDERHLRRDPLRGEVVGHGLHHPEFDPERRPDQLLAVPGHRRASNARPFPHRAGELAKPLERGLERPPLVVAVQPEADGAGGVDGDDLGRGRPRVDPEPAIAPRPLHPLHPLRLGERHPGALPFPALVLLAAAEEGGEGGARGRRGGRLPHPEGEIGQGKEGRVFRDGVRGPLRGEQLGVFGQDDVGLPQREQPGERPAERADPGEGPAGEQDRRPDGAAAGQGVDDLPRHRLEDRKGDVGGVDPAAEEVLHVGFGEHPAAGGDRVGGRSPEGHFVEFADGPVEEGGHLVDEGPGPPRAVAVHPDVGPPARVEQDQLGVLAADVDQAPELRVARAGQGGRGDDLLDEGDPGAFGQPHPGRPGAGRPHGDVAMGGPDLFQLAEEGFPGAGVVPDVIGKKDASAPLGQHHFRGGGTDVDTQPETVHDRCSAVFPRGPQERAGERMPLSNIAPV